MELKKQKELLRTSVIEKFKQLVVVEGEEYVLKMKDVINRSISADIIEISHSHDLLEYKALRNHIHKTKGTLIILELNNARYLAIEIENAAYQNNNKILKEKVPIYCDFLRTIIEAIEEATHELSI